MSNQNPTNQEIKETIEYFKSRGFKVETLTTRRFSLSYKNRSTIGDLSPVQLLTFRAGFGFGKFWSAHRISSWIDDEL